MTSRPTRSSSIPIPRSTSMASTGRNVSIETAIPIAFSAGIRPRLPSISPSAPRMSLGAGDDQRSPGFSVVRGTSTLAAASPVRIASRSFTHTSTALSRANIGSPSTFEPRVIRADTPRNMDFQCSSTTSASPSRPRRPSGTGTRTPSTQRMHLGHTDRQSLQPAVPFPRPAYLEHSALRHLLLTEAPPSLPPMRKIDGSTIDVQLAMGRRRTSMSPSTDSDDDSNLTPPREMAPPPPLPVPYDPILRLPTRWSEQVRHPLLTVSGDGRDLTYHGPSSSGEKDAAAARTSHCIPPACGIYYYEVEIVSKGQKGHISIGFAARDVRLSRLPGWEKNSWGYHGDDGYSFAAERNGTPYGPTFGTGDVIGCGIDFSQNKVFYTKNATFLGPAFDNVGKDCDIFPSVGLRHSGEAVRVNFGHEPFKFDIEYHVQQQRNYTWAKIQSTPLDKLFAAFDVDSTGTAGTSKNEKQPSSSSQDHISEERLRDPVNHLVLEYLAHHGYARTARAFQTQCERRRGLGGVISGVDATTTIGKTMDRDVAMDDEGNRGQSHVNASAWVSIGIQEGDIELRTRIVGAVIAGDIDTALVETRKHYPAVLKQEDGLVQFKLRCRKFVELVLEAAEMKKRMQAEDEDGDGVVMVGAGGISEDEEEEERMVMIGVGADGMDVDDDAPMSSLRTAGTNGYVTVPGPRDDLKRSISPGPGWTAGMSQYEGALRKAIEYGQILDADYKADRRPEVRAIYTRTFAIVACEDPAAADGEVGEVAGHEARVALANELNQAILKSQGRPERPVLEMLYRQTSACVVQLGLSGVGAAAFADIPKEFLDA